MQPYCKTDNTQPGRLTLKKLDTNNSMWFVHCAWHTPKQWRPLPVPLIFVQTVKSKRSWYLHEIFDVHAVSCHWTIRRRLNTTKTNATLQQQWEGKTSTGGRVVWSSSVNTNKPNKRACDGGLYLAPQSSRATTTFAWTVEMLLNEKQATAHTTKSPNPPNCPSGEKQWLPEKRNGKRKTLPRSTLLKVYHSCCRHQHWVVGQGVTNSNHCHGSCQVSWHRKDAANSWHECLHCSYWHLDSFDSMDFYLCDFFPPVDEVPMPTNLLLFESTTG